MKITSYFSLIIASLLFSISSFAQGDNLTPEERYKLSQKTEVYSPVPTKISAGYNNAPPSDSIAVRLILSIPPATSKSSQPLLIFMAARFTASKPEAQNLLI